ncbi:phosphate uptake regulator, PhoU [Peptoclostridium litorale DSM 5388]|uniref:Phosphate-specific transport system accessory protein PhoU n=1 Tax=Peptoclostridium litorale DSM 5388 TaxID=1121324 RepID=A0A069RM47_PEPLI|nr:phosphate signaling complex protein PhoU [Peptoclostridium litorale]KDR93850.1 phosphate-specific transport system accessory protein PhoU [Peptoclostridium litorale DSM 5388]KDR95277.1 phosphate-specific transport system accessory protein PhoU [Peptoclostridium litorale DSM 5388]SIN87108.1 phosphate uptake regulator, PhoU [Peptoclostridium litorale DSM 5388]
MLRAGFEKELNNLKTDALDMFERVEEAVKTAVQALGEMDAALARKVIKQDDIIDLKMYEIEEKAIELIALQQPMAKDLRMIFSITKIISNLERIGDFAVNIAKEVIKMGGDECISKWSGIFKMTDIFLGMMDKTKSSLLLEDPTLALEVGREDEFVDNLYREIYSDMLITIHKNSDYINQGTKILFVGRYVERMADHLTNICEMIIYIAKGERIEID